MKKIALLLALTLLISVFSVTAAASDLEISLIGGDDAFQAQDFDNMQLGIDYEVPGYASFKINSFGFYDYFAQYNKDSAGNNRRAHGENYACVQPRFDIWYHYPETYWQDSGKNAEFAWLVLDITNLQKTEVNLMKQISGKVVYDDEYEYSTWTRQFNYDYALYEGVRHIPPEGSGWWRPFEDKDICLVALDPANEEAVGMVFTGTFVIGCTLPNAIVESERPLKMVITVGDCELTYIIRK